MAPCGGAPAGRQLDEIVAVGEGGGLGTVADAELGVNMVGVPDNGVDSDHQLRGDLRIALSHRDQPQDLPLPLR